MLLFYEVGRWQVTGLAPQKSDTHLSRLHPQVLIGDAVDPLNRIPKIPGVTLDTHFFVPQALAGSNLGFMTKTLVATYKTIESVYSSTMPLLSGLPKCLHHTWTNLR